MQRLEERKCKDIRRDKTNISMETNITGKYIHEKPGASCCNEIPILYYIKIKTASKINN